MHRVEISATLRFASWKGQGTEDVIMTDNMPVMKAAMLIDRL